MDPTEIGKKIRDFVFSQVCPSAWTRESLIPHFATMVLPLRRTSSPRSQGRASPAQEVYTVSVSRCFWEKVNITLGRLHESTISCCSDNTRRQNVIYIFIHKVGSLAAVKPSPPGDNPVQCHQREQARGCWRSAGGPVLMPGM